MKKYILVLLLGVLFFSCEKTEVDPPAPLVVTPPPPPPGDPSFTIYKDGLALEYSDVISTLIIEESIGLYEARTMRIYTHILSFNKITLRVINYEWQSPPAEGILVKPYNTNTIGESEFNSCGEGGYSNQCDRGNLYYEIYQGLLYDSRLMENVDPGILEITYNDTINHVVSGNFDAMVFEKFNLLSPDTIHFSGEFENLPYSIQIL